MSFKDCRDNAPESVFLTLSQDMEEIHVMMLDEPIPFMSNYDGQKRVRYAIPVLCKDGLRILPFGDKVFKIIETRWETFKGGQVKITRFGDKGDSKTSYELVLVPTTPELDELRAKVQPLQVVNLMAKLQNPVSRRPIDGAVDDIPM